MGRDCDTLLDTVVNVGVAVIDDKMVMRIVIECIIDGDTLNGVAYVELLLVEL